MRAGFRISFLVWTILYFGGLIFRWSVSFFRVGFAVEMFFVWFAEFVFSLVYSRFFSV